jgi:hypothetical protein
MKAVTGDEKIKALFSDPARDGRLVAADQTPALLLWGYNTGTLSADTALLKIEALVQETEPSVAILPIYMSRSQCTEVGNALLRLAAMTHNPKAKPN